MLFLDTAPDSAYNVGMTDCVIINCRAVLEDRIMEHAAITIKGGYIHSIEESAALDSPSLPVVDAENNFVTPGLAEFHIHGCGNHSVDYASGQKGVLLGMRDHLALNGITTFVPALMADPELLEHLAYELTGNPELADSVPGLYVEGPFVSGDKRGGILPELVREPDLDHLKMLTSVSQGHIRLMTVAPELPGIAGIIDFLKQSGIIVCAGHSGCTMEDFRKAGNRGFDNITHLFNAMSGFSHKTPGLAMAPFLNRDLFFELNGDGIHLHPETLRACAASLSSDRGILISDAVVSAGLPYGDYHYYGKKVVSDETGVRYADELTLVGSNLCINKVILRFTEITGAPLYTAVKMAVTNPLRLLGLDRERGTIAPGKKAQLVIFDEDMNALEVFS